jgi:hypothetical protein
MIKSHKQYRQALETRYRMKRICGDRRILSTLNQDIALWEKDHARIVLIGHRKLDGR